MEAFHGSTSLPIQYTFASTDFMALSTQNPGAATSPWMDSRIWGRLPQLLLDRVIVFLPPPAFFRARCVCKRWYGLLFSESFLELYLQVSPRCHWFIFFKHKSLNSYIYSNISSTTEACDKIGNPSRANCEGYLFDPNELSWYRISFALIPSGFYPASSSGGLVCWVSDEAGTKSLVLSNPLVGSLTPLPPTFRPRLFPTIGLSITPASIDVAVAGDDLISPYAVKNLSAESFHIDSSGFFSLWGTTSNLPRLCSLESGRMVFVGGKFYCMNYSPFSILAYNVASNDWYKIQAPMRRFLRCPSLVESSGKLILVAAVEKSKLNVPRSLRLWILQACGMSWVEVERMPQQLYMQFTEMESGLGFDCVGHGEFIMIMIRGSSNKGLVFDMWRKIWQWIPPCPYNVTVGGDGGECSRELHGLAYEPRLATPVTGILDQLTLPFQHFNA
ncbi:protein UNUSUAL FLORAL ORGANS [Punica granatum]|uniref:F-box domain-containing protein n=2 Tax=Punica granatum TaxID=22663 RepID=A0A218W3L7_PUNGR|nr:protein UNUSUAL FLORAL ORGANS [Punica granatum]OWM66910.1 hypothetical protein CDL15_Pgr018399 [Punica granatum]PKI70927.1 hypothetical protein CRG98_008660 [Punica granatum]